MVCPLGECVRYVRLGVQVAVEGKGGMVLPIANYMIMAYFERVAYSETSI